MNEPRKRRVCDESEARMLAFFLVRMTPEMKKQVDRWTYGHIRPTASPSRRSSGTASHVGCGSSRSTKEIAKGVVNETIKRN